MQVLSNTPLPALSGVECRHFGECGRHPAGYKPESERRSLRTILEQLPAGFHPDLLLFLSPEYLPMPDDLEVFRGPRALLITDWNVCLRFLPPLCRRFDLCFTDTPGVRLLRRAGVGNVRHAPLFGHDPARFHNLGLTRDLDLSFCGNLNAGLHAPRNRLVYRLTQWCRQRPVHLRQAFDADYVNVLNRSRLVFNYSIRGEANMRLYEAMACGAAVLVEEGNEEAPLLFRPGEHYLTYRPESLEADCERWLQDPEALARIGRAAQVAVAEQTQTRQLERVLQQARDLGSSWRRGEASAGADVEAGKAAIKLRLLGAGYGLAEALDEVEHFAPSLPGLAAEATPGLLFLFLASAPDSKARPAALARLAAQLDDPGLPMHVKTWFRIGLAGAQKQWVEVLRRVSDCLVQLESAAAAEVDPGYSVLFAPIGLGQGINTDLNLCFRRFLETGSHAAIFELLRDLALAEGVQAAVQSGQWDQAAVFAARLRPGPWRAVSPWPWRFSLCLLRGDTTTLTEVTRAWFEADPLDARIWERVLKGLQALGDLAGVAEFLVRVLPAAVHFLTPEQMQTLRAYGKPAESVTPAPTPSD